MKPYHSKSLYRDLIALTAHKCTMRELSSKEIDELIENLLRIYKSAYGDKNSRLSLRIYDFSEKYSLNIPSLNEAVNVYDDCLDEFKLFVENRLSSRTVKDIHKKINDTCKFIIKSINHIESCKDKAVGEIEIPSCGYDNEDFEGSLEAEQANFLFDGGGTPVETGTSMVDINLIGNVFIEEMKNILQNLILEIKNELSKFEKQILLKSEGSYFDSLLKLSSEFLSTNKKQACPKDMDSLKKLLIRILEKNEDNFNKNHDVIEKISSKIERNKVENRSSTFDLYKMCEILQHVKLHSIQSKITKINAFFITDALQEIKSIISIYFEPSINELENLKIITLPITISTYGFGEEDAGRLEAEQAMNEFGNTSLNGFETGEQVIDLADIVNQINIETQNKLKEMIVEFNKLIDWFGRKYYWTDD